MMSLLPGTLLWKMSNSLGKLVLDKQIPPKTEKYGEGIWKPYRSPANSRSNLSNSLQAFSIFHLIHKRATIVLLLHWHPPALVEKIPFNIACAF